VSTKQRGVDMFDARVLDHAHTEKTGSTRQIEKKRTLTRIKDRPGLAREDPGMDARINPEVVIPAVVTIGLGYVLIPAIIFRMIEGKEPRTVVCPDNLQPAVVRLKVLNEVRGLFVACDHEISACTRWPSRAACNQACVA
jgi:hypothetical protein